MFIIAAKNLIAIDGVPRFKCIWSFTEYGVYIVTKYATE